MAGLERADFRMKNNRLQCKDLSGAAIVEHIYRINKAHDAPAMLVPPEDSKYSVWPTYSPVPIPEKLLRAKLRQLIDHGWITGCACGCRGDFWNIRYLSEREYA